jgi:HD-like signal output (HDOD) protein
MRSGSDLHSLEKKFLGIDHCQAGSWLARAWNLPQKLISSIEFHHDPGKVSANSDIVNITFFSNLFSHAYKESDFENIQDEILEIYEDIQKNYNLENLTSQKLQEIAGLDDFQKGKEFKFSESLSKYN